MENDKIKKMKLKLNTAGIYFDIYPLVQRLKDISFYITLLDITAFICPRIHI